MLPSAPIRTQPLQVTVQLPQALQANASGSVDASLDGEVDAAIAKPIQYERIQIGL